MTATEGQERHNIETASFFRKYGPAVCLALLCLPAALVHIRCDILPDDDAYITYRYADNLVARGELAYNSGEKVFGVSSPLYLFWIAILKAIFRHIPTDALAVRTNVAWFILAALGCHQTALLASQSVTAATVVAAVCLLHPMLLEISIAGMEPFMFLAFFSWSLALAMRNKKETAAFLLGLSFLARPEAAACALAFAPLVRASPPGRLLRIAACALAIPLAWSLWLWKEFGNPLPHSISAKLSGVYPLPIFNTLFVMLDEIWSAVASTAPANIGFIITVLTVAFAAGGDHIRRGNTDASRSLAVLLWFWSVLVFYALTNPLFMTWYRPLLLVPLFSVLLALVGPSAGSWFERPYFQHNAGHAVSHHLKLALTFSAAAFFLAAQWHARYRSGGHIRSVYRDADPAALRVIAYLKTGQWLQGVDGQSVVASSEIGALGYSYCGPILDVCGLVSPQAIPYLPVPSDQRGAPEIGAISPALISDKRPKWIVTMDIFAAWGLYHEPWFSSLYEKVRSFPLPTEIWGCRAIRVFRLKEVPDNATHKPPNEGCD